jgi:hypothetical protein
MSGAQRAGNCGWRGGVSSVASHSATSPSRSCGEKPVPALNTALPPCKRHHMMAMGASQARAASRASRSAPECGSTWSANAGSTVGTETDTGKHLLFRHSIKDADAWRGFFREICKRWR